MRFVPLAALLLLAAAPAALAQDGLDRDAAGAPPAAAFLDDAALTAVFTGAELEGCYPDGSIWAERTARGGALYDMLRRGRDSLVGDWWVADGMVCYHYTPAGDRAENTACWQVIAQDGEFYFYFPGTGEIGGTTDCGDPIA